MIVSVTELGEYRRCRWRWDAGSRNRRALTKIVPAPALGLGTALHAALEDWFKIRDLPLRTLFLNRANDAIETARATYLAQVGALPHDSELASLYESVELGSAMMTNYEAFWKVPLPDTYDLVSTEQRVAVPIPGTEHTLQGRLDAIVRRKRDGLLYVMDHKSFGSRPNLADLAIEDQFLLYHWMLTQLVGDPDEVGGLAYNGMWKRPAPPSKVDGRVGTLADLFCRTRVTHPREELAIREEALAMEVTEMADPKTFIYRSTQGWNGACRWGCDYNELCIAHHRGEDAEHVRRTRYTLKAPDTTEQEE